MKKTFLIFIFACSLSYAKTEEKQDVGKNQSRTFTNKRFGYQLKYPDCWEVTLSVNADEVAPPESDLLSFDETEKCRSGLPINKRHGLEMRPSFEIKSIQDRLKEMNALRRFYNVRQAAITILFSKEFNEKGNERFIYAQGFDDSIKWELQVFCKDQIFVMTMMDYFPTPEKRAAIKKGEILIPEPEKTVFESFECIPKEPYSAKEKVKKEQSKK